MSNTKNNGKSAQKVHKSLKKLKKAIKAPNSALAIFYMKQRHLSHDTPLDDETMSLLLSIIRDFMKSEVYIECDVDAYLCGLLKKISAESSELHLRCVSLLSCSSNPECIEIYRNMFGYSKIYTMFKDQTSDMFSEALDPEFLLLLMRLLDNKELVYKNLSPMISKLNTFILQGMMIDKSISGCCTILSSLLKVTGELINSVMAASVLSYLNELLADPQNHIFISPAESKIMVDTVEELVNHVSKDIDNEEIDAKKLSTGILRILIDRIKKYRHSTVYEEVMVVLSATRCLEPIFRLFMKAGNRNIEILEPDLLRFVIFDRPSRPKDEASTGESSDEIKKEKKGPNGQNLLVDFERPFKHHYNAKYQALRDDFIVYKYKFLDLFWHLTNTFERVEFLNDLGKIEETHRLLKVLNNLKESIEWSDLVVYACNAPNIGHYIPFIFDSYFIASKEHGVFLDIFLGTLINKRNKPEEARMLVYFTRYAIDARNMQLLARLYLVDLASDDNFAKRRREIILRFIASLGVKEKDEDTGEEAALLKTKSVEITTDQKPHGDDVIEKLKTIEIKEIVRKGQGEPFILDKIPLMISAEAEVFVEALCEHLDEVHYNLGPLLVVLANKRLNTGLLDKYLECLNGRLNDDRKYFHGEETVISVFALLCGLYRHWYFDNREIVTAKDIFIVVMCAKIARLGRMEIERIKAKAFDVLIGLKAEEFEVARALRHVLKDGYDGDNGYVKRFNSIVEILCDDQ